MLDETFVRGARKALLLGALDDVSVETIDLELRARVEIELGRWKVVSVRR